MAGHAAGMSKKQQARWTRSHARQVLARAAQQGLSTTELARELGVSPQRIYRWRSRLQEPAELPHAGFVEVIQAPPPSSRPFTVHTASGCRVEVWPGFDQTELTRLVAALEQVRC